MECQICSQPDCGNHYGAITCRACAAFFRRTLQLNLKYECRNNESCNLKKETRYSCRFCRMKRCQAVGMTFDESPDSSNRVPDLSISAEEDSPLIEEEDEFYSSKNILKEDFAEKLTRRADLILASNISSSSSGLPYTRTICQQAAVAYANLCSKWSNCTKEKIVFSDFVDVFEVVRNYHKQFENIAYFCMEIEPFCQLPHDQKMITLKKFAVKFIELDQNFKNVQLLGGNVDDIRYLTLSGIVFDSKNVKYNIERISNCTEEQIKSAFTNLENECTVVFIKPFKKVNPDHFEFIYLLMVAMWSIEEKRGVSEEYLERALEIRERLSEELHSYYKYEKRIANYAGRIYKLHSLLNALDRLGELHGESNQLAKTFDLFNVDVHLSNLTL